jgi:hypothetical protein
MLADEITALEAEIAAAHSALLEAFPDVEKWAAEPSSRGVVGGLIALGMSVLSWVH